MKLKYINSIYPRFYFTMLLLLADNIWVFATCSCFDFNQVTKSKNQNDIFYAISKKSSGPETDSSFVSAVSSPFWLTETFLRAADPRTPTSAQEVKAERLSQHHLACSQHAAPAAVWRQSGVGQRWEVHPVRQPHFGAKIPAESLHIPHDGILTSGVAALVGWTVVIWGWKESKTDAITTLFCTN